MRSISQEPALPRRRNDCDKTRILVLLYWVINWYSSWLFAKAFPVKHSIVEQHHCSSDWITIHLTLRGGMYVVKKGKNSYFKWDIIHFWHPYLVHSPTGFWLLEISCISLIWFKFPSIKKSSKISILLTCFCPSLCFIDFSTDWLLVWAWESAAWGFLPAARVTAALVCESAAPPHLSSPMPLCCSALLEQLSRLQALLPNTPGTATHKGTCILVRQRLTIMHTAESLTHNNL